MRHTIRLRVTAGLAVAAMGASLVAAGPVASAAPSGSLTVLEPGATGGTWNSLDPVADTTSAANWDELNPIYGELFEQGQGSKVVPDLASGDKISADGKTVTISLRTGLKFTDGTAFDAAAVQWNFERDFNKKNACICGENFAAVKSVTTQGPDTVVLHLAQRDPAIIDAFIGEAPDWIVSPTAFKKEGATAFGLKPVGAGPFKVTQAIANTKLVLAANPGYWKAGDPKVANLTFLSVNSDQNAMQAMQAGQGQIYTSLTSLSSLPSAEKSFTVATIPSTETLSISLNPGNAPFDNIKAREAIYYALDAQAINKSLYDDKGLIVQTPSAPGDRYWEKTVKGYRTYDLAKAKALVKQLGGLKFTMSTLSLPTYVSLSEAYKSLFAAAGIDATIQTLTIPQSVKETQNGTLQAVVTQAGSFDPALIPGLAAWYASTGPFSLVHDKALDKLIDAAAATTNPATAQTDYDRVYAYLNTKAYGPDILAPPAWRVQTKSVSGIPADTTEVQWENVALAAG